jgi:hypothetical protein
MLLLALAIVTLAAVAITLAQVVAGYRAISRLGDQPPAVGSAGSPPSVAVIIAARDEAAHIEEALSSVLAQAYPRYEVVVVDDRSTDETGAILDRIAEREPRLRVVHLDTLPDGWLGKTHALDRGAAATDAEWILFTDADVRFAPTALGRAIGLVTARGIDHLVVGPELHLRTLPLALVVNYFMLGFMLWLRPWKATDPSSERHIGIGAFNLVRASTYRAMGGHRPIALRPDDDVKLGKLAKRHGARQQLASGEAMIWLEWYGSLGEMARGLRKNSFAGLEYSIAAFLGVVALTLVVNVWPFVAIVVTHGATRALNATTALLLVALSAYSAWQHRSRPWLAVFYPIAALIFLWIVTDATVRTLATGGIEWRGTRYDLDELRGNRV